MADCLVAHRRVHPYMTDSCGEGCPSEADMTSLSAIFDYAKTVAASAQRLPDSTYTVWHKSETKKMFKTVTQHVRESRSYGGWLLVVDPEEGFATHHDSPVAPTRYIHAFEEGRFLLLGRDGLLRSGHYDQHYTYYLRGACDPQGNSCTISEVHAISADDIARFDRLNTDTYKECSSTLIGDVWRRELDYRGRVAAPFPGAVTLKVLKGLHEHQTYIQEYTITL